MVSTTSVDVQEAFRSYNGYGRIYFGDENI